MRKLLAVGVFQPTDSPHICLNPPIVTGVASDATCSFRLNLQPARGPMPALFIATNFASHEDLSNDNRAHA